MATMTELQARLDEMFSQGARVCTDLENEDNNYIFWVSYVPMVADDVVLIVPTGVSRMDPFQFEGEPEISDGEVVFRNARPFNSDLPKRSLRLDSKFSPGNLSEAIAEERAYMVDEGWLSIQRKDFAAEREAVENGG